MYQFTLDSYYAQYLDRYIQSVSIMGRSECKEMEQNLVSGFMIIKFIKKWLYPSINDDRGCATLEQMQDIETYLNTILQGSASLFRYPQFVAEYKYQMR